MAIPALRHKVRPHRSLIVASALGLIGALVALGLLSLPAGATADSPDTVTSVLSHLRTVAVQNEHLSEQINLMTADLTTKRQAAAVAQAAATAADAKYAEERATLTSILAAQYEANSSFGRTGALLNSSSQEAYADRVATLDMMSARRADLLTAVAATKTSATKARAAADGLLAVANAKQAELTKHQSALANAQKKYDASLLSLTAAQRTQYQTYGEVSQNIGLYLLHTGPIAAQTAVNFALAQVGKPYVFAAAGPTTYDCSGLTMAAWAAAGVKLPHYAATQYDYGTHVAEADLQPGDLIFMYQPIDHVTIYIGHGLMVSAPEPGDHVKIVTVASQQDIYVGATRLT